MTNLLHSPYANPAFGLLALLSDEDVTALVKTASAGRIQPVNRKEASTAVLLTCPDVAKLLSYRKLTSHLLLQYLFSQGYAPKGHVSRTQLVIAVMEIWDKQLKKKKEATRETKEETSSIHPSFVKQERAFQTELDVQQHQQQAQREQPHLIADASQISTNKSAVEHYSLSSCGNPHLPPAYHLHYPNNDGSSMNRLTNCTDFTNTFIDNSAAVATSSQCLQTDSLSQQTNTSIVRVMSDEFSQEFCDWFYTMFNRLQPECSHQPGDTLRPDIFCSNCTTEMYLVEDGRQEECKAEGGSESERVIRHLLLKLKLLFAPNTVDGTQARKSSHGMIQLFCCGTLHFGNSFIGIFEQEFGLVVSPIDKAWKIAYTKVNLKKVNSVQTPSLPRCEVFAIDM